MSEDPNIHIWQTERHTLTVAGLIDALQKYPKELPVWVYFEDQRFNLQRKEVVLQGMKGPGVTPCVQIYI